MPVRGIVLSWWVGTLTVELVMFGVAKFFFLKSGVAISAKRKTPKE